MNDAVQVLQSLLSGGLKLWDSFVAFVQRVGVSRLLAWGFDEGSLLVGGIIRRGLSLSDEALHVVDNIGDELAKAGIRLSDDAADGLALVAKSLNSRELQIFTNTLKAKGPEHLETILTAYKNFGTATRDGAEKIAQKLGGENFAELMSRYATNSDDADQVFRVLGNTNISDDALSIAMKQGPDSVKALSYWDKTLLDNPTIARELAERAQKDVLALQAVDNLIAQGGSNTVLINQIADFSMQNNGSYIVLGKWSNLDGGYAKVARDAKATYFYPHPDIYNRLEALGPANQQSLWWAIDSSAIRSSADNSITFKYTLLDAPVEDEQALIELMNAAKTHMPSETIVDHILASWFTPAKGYTKIPDRMEEIKIIILADYKITLDSSGLYVFSPR